MVVTAVAGHYAIGCVTAECDTHLCLESYADRINALVRAYELAGTDRRVSRAHSKRMSELIDCTDVARYAKVSTVCHADIALGRVQRLAAEFRRRLRNSGMVSDAVHQEFMTT